MKNALKILIVDDDKSSAQMLSEVVKRMGFKPIVTGKTNEALNTVKLQTVHAALVDVLLPKMSGVDLVMEFRNTKFGDNPVILLSGVFKDKSFSADAMKKTGAIEFLFKPFAIEDLMAVLKNAFKDTLSVERWTVHSLLSKKLPTARERAKAIEHLDQIQGNDFPYILGLMMEGGISGHLNIVSETGEIFGVTLIKGLISDVDSSESQSAGVLALINSGFLNQQDWDEFQQAGNRKFTLERLVQEGYVSPHAVGLAKHEQILADLKSICTAETLRLNFGPNDGEETPPKHAVELRELLDQIFTPETEFFKNGYLNRFYKDCGKRLIQVANLERLSTRWEHELFKPFPNLKDIVHRGGTLEDILKDSGAKEEQMLLAFHFLVTHRDVLFDDVERTKTQTANIERFKKMLEDLDGRSPDSVFEYFGAGPMANQKAVETIYGEYVKSNSPDALPKDASPELRDYCIKCLNIVKDAHDVMMDEEKRNQVVAKKKSEGAERIKKANELLTNGLELLRKGQFAQAVAQVKEAEKLHASNVQFFIRVWAEIKANPTMGKDWLIATATKLDKMSTEDKKSAYFFMAMGLVRKAQGEVDAAHGLFEKAVSADAGFMEARRELNAISNAKEKDKKVDILTGDITQVISQIFRRKAE